MQTLNDFMPVIDLLLKVVIIPALIVIVAKLGSKYVGVQMSADQRYQLEEILRKAVAYAEEYARTKAKAGGAVDGATKLSKAVDFAVAEIQRRKLDVVGREKLENLLHAVLHVERVYNQLPAPTPPAEPVSQEPATGA